MIAVTADYSHELHNNANLFHLIVQTRVEALPPISKHREELKFRGEA